MEADIGKDQVARWQQIAAVPEDPNRLFVFYEEDGSADSVVCIDAIGYSHLVVAWAHSPELGRKTLMRVPWPGVLTTSIVPPWLRTIQDQDRARRI
jgi:hypothetical protein